MARSGRPAVTDGGACVMSVRTGEVSTGCCCGRDHLTHREIDVLVLVAAGQSNTEIARRLYLSTDTVGHHIHDMLTRTGAHNRAELVARSYVGGRLDGRSWPPIPTGRRCVGTSPAPLANPRATGGDRAG